MRMRTTTINEAKKWFSSNKQASAAETHEGPKIEAVGSAATSTSTRTVTLLVSPKKLVSTTVIDNVVTLSLGTTLEGTSKVLP